MYKNIDAQKVAIYAHDTANDAPKTGDQANITAYISKDGGGASQTNDVNPTQLDAANLPGVYVFDLLQEETNCDLFVLVAQSVTADVQIEAVIAYTLDQSSVKADVSNLDTTVSSRSSHTAANVWAVEARTLTSFGTLVSDVATAVWSAVSRTLSSFGTLVNDITGGTTVASAESNIRGSDSDDLKDISDQLDIAQADLDNPDQYKADVSNLDTTVSSRSSHTAANVWSVAVRGLTEGVDATSIEGKALGAKVGDNFNTFFQNDGSDTSKVVDDVGIGTTAKDWTDSEREQIRKSLGVTGDSSSTTGTGVVDQILTEVGNLATLGEGAFTVNQDSGGSGNLRPVIGGVAINNMMIKAYLKSDYDAGNLTSGYIKAIAETDVNGDFAISLDPGDYTIQASKQDVYVVNTKNIRVAADGTVTNI